MNRVISNNRKRRIKDEKVGYGVDGGDEFYDSNSNESSSEEGGKKKDLKGIVTSLLHFEEQKKGDKHLQNKASAEEKSFLEANHKKKMKMKKKKKKKTMLECYSDSNVQNYYTKVQETEYVNRKKSCALAKSVASITCIASDSQVVKQGTDDGDSGGGGGDGGSGQRRRLWVKDRSKAWWDECNRPDYPEEEFKKWFRMTKETFDVICEELNSVIVKEDTTLRNAIPVRQRVAVCIWRLATGEPLRLLSKRFGLGISTCHKLILEVCTAIKSVLMPKYLQWPDDPALRKIKDEFEVISSGIPNVVGSMYTTHIPIIAPKVSVAAYFNKQHTERNQKTSYSVTVQGVVNPKGVFTDICIGWPGSMPDDQVLGKSALYQRAIGGLLKSVWIVGGSGYPLMDWVLVPYAQQHLTWTQHAFNEKIGEIQRVAKDAFARLKGRWSCLQKRTEIKLQDLPVVLGACCVLHNVCETRNEEMDPEWAFDLVDDEMIPEVALRSTSSMKARDSIAHNLLHHGLAGTAFL